MIANLNNLKNLDSYSICSNLSFCKQTTNFNEKAESINKTVAVLDSLWKNRNVIARKSEKYIKQWIKSTIQQLQQITDLGELWLQVARKKVEAILEEIDAEEEH